MYIFPSFVKLLSIFLVVWLFYKIAICRFWNIAWSFSNKNENQIDLNLGWPNDLLIFLADQLIWFSWQKKVNSLVKSIVIPNKIKKRSIHYWDRVLKVKKILAASCINEVVSVYILTFWPPAPKKGDREKMTSFMDDAKEKHCVIEVHNLTASFSASDSNKEITLQDF